MRVGACVCVCGCVYIPLSKRCSQEVQLSSCISTVKAWTAHRRGGSWKTSWRVKVEVEVGVCVFEEGVAVWREKSCVLCARRSRNSSWLASMRCMVL